VPKVVAIDTREKRKSLETRDRPYYRDVSKGIAVGYRKGISGGTWSIRTFSAGRYYKRHVGLADDTAPADGVTVFAWRDVARIALAQPTKSAELAGRCSVADAVEDYFNSRSANSRSAESVNIDKTKLKAFTARFGGRQVSELTTRDLQAWRDRLASPPPEDQELTEAQRREYLRAAQATANRIWSICRAALNSAFRNGRVDSDIAWRRIRPFKGVDEPRRRFLSVSEANSLLGACDGRFRDLVHAALLTGLRPGELTRLVVGQFQQTRIEVAQGKTGRGRFVPLTTQGMTLFKRLVKGRGADDLLLPNREGKQWTRIQISREMRAACADAKLETPAVFYDLRRRYGSLLATAHPNDATIAHALGHSDTRMTRRHYAHLLDATVAAEVQAKLPIFTPRRPRKKVAER
jgi:integrase